MSEHLERASTSRARCRLCKDPIEQGTLRMGVRGDSRSYDGTMTIWHHALCAAIQRPAAFLRASAFSNEIPQTARAPFEAVANAIRARKLVKVAWRHASAPRCLLEFADDHYVLLTQVGDQALVVRGPLQEVVAAVPDDDLDAVVTTLARDRKI